MSTTPSYQFFDVFDTESIRQFYQKQKHDGTKPVVFAMLAEADKDKVESLQQLATELDIQLLGAIFPALIFDACFRSNGLLLVSLPSDVSWKLLADISADITQIDKSIEKVQHAIESNLTDDSDSSLFMIFDAMLPNIATILDELYVAFGDSVHYMGVNAGSETFQPMPCLFDNTRLIQNGLLTLLLRNHHGALLEHGYVVPEETIVATSTAGNRIDSINWQPAFEIYAERVKEQYQVEINRENFYEHAVHFPFGIIRADNEVLVRIPVMLDDDNALFCVGEIPENSVLTLLDAPQANSLHTVDKLSSQSSSSPLHLLYYCAGRRMHLGDAADQELKDYQKNMGVRLNIGALSLGEIGSSHSGGYPLFHNATLVDIPVI